jgi:type IV pilus assembly protein PilC
MSQSTAVHHEGENSTMVRSRSKHENGKGTSEPRSTTRTQHTPGAGRIRTDELPGFTRGLAAMLSAGLPLIACLKAMEEQVSARGFQIALQKIRTSVQYGNRLSISMSHFPDIFDDIYISMLQTGEISGRLPETLERLAEHLEDAADLRRQVQSALMYPLTVAAIAIILACAIMIWIVPAFEDIYADLGGRLPFATRALIAASHGLRAHGLLIGLGFIILLGAIRQVRRNPRGAYLWDRMMLQLPVFGNLTQEIALARFAEAMGQMLHNGVAILKAIELSSRVTHNRVLCGVLERARHEVQQGESLSQSLKKSRWYPSLLVQMLAIGEHTGRMDEMLDRIGKFYRSEVSVMLKGLTSLIEPMLIVFLGVIIGGMVICMFIPIFRLHELVKF